MNKEFRQHIDAIVKLTDEEFKYVSSHFTTKKLKKHQFLVQEGDPVHYDYWVARGLLKAYHSSNDGKEHILQFAMEDWWITDYQAYTYQTNATINIDCLEDVELLCLSFQAREKICADLHKMEHFFRKKTGAGYIALQRRILSLLTGSAKERYDLFVAQYPRLLQRVPKTLIAAYLGMSRETLSRFNAAK